MRNPIQTRAAGFPYRSVWEDFDRLFESFTPRFHTDFVPTARSASAINQSVFDQATAFQPAIDVEETESAYLMSFDVPGVAKEDLHIEIQENQLRISGERRREHRGERNGADDGFSGGIFRSGRSFGRFERAFILPRDVDTSRVEAQHEDGVLRLVLPKTEAVRARPIPIASGRKEEGTGFFSKWLNKAKTIDEKASAEKSDQ